MDERAQRFRDELHRAYASGRSMRDPATIVDVARKADYRLDLSEAVTLMGAYGEETGIVLPQETIVSFLSKLLAQVKARVVLDPWARIGNVLLPILERDTQLIGEGIVRNEAEHELLGVIRQGNLASWKVSQPDGEIEHGNEVDAVLCLVPTSPRGGYVELKVAGKMVRVPNDLGCNLIVNSLTKLSPTGIGLFLVYPNMVPNRRNRHVFQAIGDLGFRVSACVALPVEKRMSGPAPALVVVRKGSPGPMLVGELSEDEAQNTVLLNNVIAGKEGKDLPLGRHVAVEAFESYGKLQANEVIKLATRGVGLPPTKVDSVALAAIRCRDTETFADKENSVYVPIVGFGTVFVGLKEIEGRHHKYIQVVLDSSKCDARYLAAFLNTDLGRKIRATAATGVTIQRISPDALREMDVFLPPPSGQELAVETDLKIRSLMNELQELQRRVWTKPRQLDEVSKELARVNVEDRFTDWIDLLPFPLGSILWMYHTCGDDHEKKYRHLLHFFEAVTQFMAVVLLSGVLRQRSAFEEELKAVAKSLDEGRLTVGRSSFGTWRVILEVLAKRIRSMSNAGLEERSRLNSILPTSDTDVIGMLCSSSTIGLLTNANNLRNSWTGHGGVTGDQENRLRHNTLGDLLSQLRTVFSDHWEGMPLIQAGMFEFMDGTYRLHASRIMGRCAPFEPISVDSVEPVNKGALCLFSIQDRKPLPLLPLIKVRPSPKTEANACYFYNRLQNDGVRFVSYHFPQESEITEPAQDTVQTLQLLDQVLSW